MRKVFHTEINEHKLNKSEDERIIYFAGKIACDHSGNIESDSACTASDSLASSLSPTNSSSCCDSTSAITSSAGNTTNYLHHKLCSLPYETSSSAKNNPPKFQQIGYGRWEKVDGDDTQTIQTTGHGIADSLFLLLS